MSKKITELNKITTIDPAVDMVPIVDVSDTTDSPQGTTKYFTKDQITTPATGTGTALAFVEDKVYGTIASPVTGNITGVITDAKLGVTVIVIHNHSLEPTFDAKFKKLSGSGDYTTGEVNYIFCCYINDTEIIYSISQRI